MSLVARVPVRAAPETSPGTQPSSTAPSPPNVVMIVSDDQGWGEFGFMGHPVVKTPHLDRLASESAVFPNGYVPTSLCRASLATILTGRYAHEHKICCNDPPAGVDRAAMLPFMRGASPVPALLGEHLGYLSLQTGKWWEGHFGNGGFTHGMTESKVKGRHGDVGLVIGRETMRPVFDFIEGARAQRKPFFVWYAPMLPHEPHNPPERLLAKYRADGRDLRLAKYYAMVEWFDETCGQLLSHLDQKGLRDDTLVVFVIDNGWIQQTGPQPATRRTRGNFAPKSKLSPYDGGLRTPVMLRWPGRTKAGRYDDLVSTIDLAPTLLRAAGLEPAKDLPGLDLLDAAAGRSTLPRDAVFGEIFEHTSKDVNRPAVSLTHRWVREGDWKLILPTGSAAAPPELYDVAHDPTEERNRAAETPERVKHLTQRIDAWWKADDAGPAINR